MKLKDKLIFSIILIFIENILKIFLFTYQNLVITLKKAIFAKSTTIQIEITFLYMI